MAISHTYNPVTHDYLTSAEDFGHVPANATRAPLPPRPWTRQWPRWTGNAWELVVDHRERKAPEFLAEDAQEGTPYWLPEDSWDTPARHVFAPGPLPDGALMERPEKPVEQALGEAKEAKTAEIEEGYKAAFAATLTMPQAEPTEPEITAAAGLFAAEDPEGLAYVVAQLGATRQALLDQVTAAATLEDVDAIVVRYVV